jgi:hypothetical protein
LPQTFGVLAPQIPPALLDAQSAFVQQLPVTQTSAQQTSAALAAQAEELVVHAPETQAPVDVLQIVFAPYVGSLWHWPSLSQRPHWFAVDRPQISPALPPAQSASVLQLPATQLPAVLHT